MWVMYWFAFSAKRKVRTDVSDPSRRGFLRQPAPESVVHFNGGELRGIELQEVLGRDILGIEAGFQMVYDQPEVPT